MRISDWSSDVCSSDLREGMLSAVYTIVEKLAYAIGAGLTGLLLGASGYIKATSGTAVVQPQSAIDAIYFLASIRSEEHTSELQSLMRISYAVFCLKKKTDTKHPTKEYRTNNK